MAHARQLRRRLGNVLLNPKPCVLQRAIDAGAARMLCGLQRAVAFAIAAA